MTTDFRVYCVTWNVAGTPPPKDFTSLLQLKAMVLPDLYVIGLQELDASVQNVVSNAMYDDPWTLALMTCLGGNYFKVKSLRMVGLHIAVFVKRDKLHYVTNVESEYTRRGSGGIGLKGGVTVRMDISGIDSCFVNCHFTPHDHNLQPRIEDFLGIVESQKFRDPDVTNILDHDYVFFIGDMNFRIDDLSNDEVKRRIDDADYDYLYERDQLKKVRDKGLIFIDFEEAPIRFPPTFKFDMGTDTYDTSPKQRKPAWCDRILWMVHEDSFQGVKLDVTNLQYKSIAEYKQSDHKPVIGLFIIKVLKEPPPLPVSFVIQSTWLLADDAIIKYSIIKNQITPAANDWVGLYPATFNHAMQYVTWQWAATKPVCPSEDGVDTFELSLPRRYFSECVGTFRLAYFSKFKNCLVGFSNEFKISLVPDLTSSSESSSDDDDIPTTIRKKKAQ